MDDRAGDRGAPDKGRNGGPAEAGVDPGGETIPASAAAEPEPWRGGAVETDEPTCVALTDPRGRDILDTGDLRELRAHLLAELDRNPDDAVLRACNEAAASLLGPPPAIEPSTVGGEVLELAAAMLALGDLPGALESFREAERRGSAEHWVRKRIRDLSLLLRGSPRPVRVGEDSFSPEAFRQRLLKRGEAATDRVRRSAHRWAAVRGAEPAPEETLAPGSGEGAGGEAAADDGEAEDRGPGNVLARPVIFVGREPGAGERHRDTAQGDGTKDNDQGGTKC
jgi:hypothetical protein